MQRSSILATVALGVAILALAVAVLALWRAHEARALARQSSQATSVQQLLPLLEKAPQTPPGAPPGPSPTRP